MALEEEEEGSAEGVFVMTMPLVARELFSFPVVHLFPGIVCPKENWGTKQTKRNKRPNNSSTFPFCAMCLL